MSSESNDRRPVFSAASGARIDYRLRRSSRARRVRLLVTPERGLEVVVPQFFRASEIPRLLDGKRRWIQAALARAQTRRAHGDLDAPWNTPARIELPALGRTWEVSATKTAARTVAIRMPDVDSLHLRGAVHDEAACHAALGRWLVRQAQVHLIPRLSNLAAATGLRHGRVFIRRQKTRWASCSRRRAISLNAKLLFLEPELMEYVLLHELCHTVELNHSKRFWALVQRHCPAYRARDAQLRDMWYRIPRWAR